jgi:hypothetical protein
MTQQPGEIESRPSASLDELDALLRASTTLELDRRQHSSASRMILSTALAILIGLGIMLIGGLPVMLRVYLLFGWTVLYVIVTGASPFPLLRSHATHVSETDADVIRALEQLDNPRAIGILIDGEAASGGGRQLAIQAALTRLLPRAGELGQRPWNDEQVERLYTHLDAFGKLTYYTTTPVSFSAYPLGGAWEPTKVITDEFPELREEYVAFLLAIVQALAVAGDSESARRLETVVAGKPRSSQIKQVQTAAWEAIDAIHARLEAEREGRTLLRPTDEPPGPLLRPARNPGEAAPESLLRPRDDG